MNGSWMSREVHVQFWERVGVKFPCATHLHHLKKLWQHHLAGPIAVIRKIICDALHLEIINAKLRNRTHARRTQVPAFRHIGKILRE